MILTLKDLLFAGKWNNRLDKTKSILTIIYSVISQQYFLQYNCICIVGFSGLLIKDYLQMVTLQFGHFTLYISLIIIWRVTLNNFLVYTLIITKKIIYNL